MDQTALYRKYRPHNFDNLVGQDHVKTTLINALKANRVSHAYLFSGPRGTGKTSTARLLAKSLDCVKLTEKFNPCDECEFCLDINEGKLIDLIEIDAASNRGIDEVRDLKEKINFAPTRAKRKVYIIDEVHMMTKEAFNALLKTLEEPPSHAYFILATTEIHKIPETIISRCQRFDFKRVSTKALMTRLSYIAQMEGIMAEDKALEVISRYVDGGLRDAIGLLEQLTREKRLDYSHVQDILGVSDVTLLEELFGILSSKDSKAALKIIHELHDQGSDLRKFTHEFVDILRNKLLLSVSSGDLGMASKLMHMIEIFQDAQEKIHTSSISQLPLEMAVIKVTESFGNIDQCPLVVSDVKKVEKIITEVKPSKASNPPEKAALGQAKVSEATSGNVEKIELNLSNLIEHWPRITERIKSPSLRMSLKNAVPVKVSDSDVTLEFSTTFHKDKTMEHGYRVELESVIRDVTSHPVRILSTVKELEIKPVVDIVDEALGIFGGEVVDDT